MQLICTRQNSYLFIQYRKYDHVLYTNYTRTRNIIRLRIHTVVKK